MMPSGDEAFAIGSTTVILLDALIQLFRTVGSVEFEVDRGRGRTVDIDGEGRVLAVVPGDSVGGVVVFRVRGGDCSRSLNLRRIETGSMRGEERGKGGASRLSCDIYRDRLGCMGVVGVNVLLLMVRRRGRRPGGLLPRNETLLPPAPTLRLKLMPLELERDRGSPAAIEERRRGPGDESTCEPTAT